MSDDIIPYTHWAYFSDEKSARACADTLADYVTRVDPPLPSDPFLDNIFPDAAKESPQWLLRAARDVEIGCLTERHGEVETVVNKYGGKYDGGESNWVAAEGGFTAVPDLALDNPTDPRNGGDK